MTGKNTPYPNKGTMIEYRMACQQRKRKKRDRLVVAAIVSVFSLMATSLPLAYYTLCAL